MRNKSNLSGIIAELNSNIDKKIKKKPKVVRFSKYRIIGMAASVVLLIGLSFLIGRYVTNLNKSTIAESMNQNQEYIEDSKKNYEAKENETLEEETTTDGIIYRDEDAQEQKKLEESEEINQHLFGNIVDKNMNNEEGIENGESYENIDAVENDESIVKNDAVVFDNDDFVKDL